MRIETATALVDSIRRASRPSEWRDVIYPLFLGPGLAMPKWAWCLIVIVLLAIGFLPASAAAPEPYGLAAMLDLERLPYLKLDTQAGGQSSYDRSGGNEDSNNFLYKDENGDQVMLDLKGPGTVYRFWVTGKDVSETRLKFYFDGEQTPRVNMLLTDMFTGSNPPFLKPLIADRLESSGGYISYVPMPFQQRIKIAVSGAAYHFFYDIGYHVYTSDTAVTTFTSSQDNISVREMWNRTGRDPKNESGNATVADKVNLPAGTLLTLLDITGPRSISSLRLRIPGVERDFQGVNNILTSLSLRIFWDNEAKPSVDAPLGSLFGIGQFDFYPTRSLMLGIDSADYLYIFFPMPFEKRAVVQLVSQRPVQTDNIAYEIKYKTVADSFKNVGYFKTRYAHQLGSAGDGKDILVLDTEGIGHFVGIVQSMQGGIDYAYLEGDERIYVDGSPTPAIHGTGTEDYYNGGWYFENGPFSLPLHGNTVMVARNGYGWMAAYRLFLQDAIPFSKHLKIGMEHGGTNDKDADVWTLAMYYLQPIMR